MIKQFKDLAAWEYFVFPNSNTPLHMRIPDFGPWNTLNLSEYSFVDIGGDTEVKTIHYMDVIPPTVKPQKS